MAARIARERHRLGLTQVEAARLLGLSRGYYKSLEKSANPQYRTLVALVTVLGMDPRAIMTEVFDAPG